MKKLTLLTACALTAFSLPAFADNIESDVGAVHKDNAAIQHDEDNLAANRAAKAADKANGDWAKQAIDSARIGANQAAKAEKETEKSVDQKILNNDKNP